MLKEHVDILLATHEFPPYPGGIGRFCKETLDAACAQGYRVAVAAPNHNAVTDATNPSENNIHRFNGDIFKPVQLPRLVFHLRKIVQSHSFDVLHIADWPVLLALPWIGLQRDTKVVMTFHGTDAIVLSRAKKVQLLLPQLGINKLNRVCANSLFTLGLVEQHLKLPIACDKRVTHLGVSSYWFEHVSDTERTEIRHICNAAPTDRIVLTVARLDRRKGHAHAMEALSRLPENEKEKICYLIVGGSIDEAYTSELRSQAKALKVRATFAGKLQDHLVRAAYAEANLFLLLAEPDPHRIEGFGLVFLEAAAQGLMSLATDVHAIREVVVEGRNGKLVRSGDPSEASKQISTLLTDTAAHAQKQSCTAHARTFSWARCAELTYQGMLKS